MIRTCVLFRDGGLASFRMACHGYFHARTGVFEVAPDHVGTESDF